VSSGPGDRGVLTASIYGVTRGGAGEGWGSHSLTGTAGFGGEAHCTHSLFPERADSGLQADLTELWLSAVMHCSVSPQLVFDSCHTVMASSAVTSLWVIYE
jgi:hypothetical protein